MRGGRAKIRIKLADGKERVIQQHDRDDILERRTGRPMSAAQFIESLFGELPRLFQGRRRIAPGLERAGHPQGPSARPLRERLPGGAQLAEISSAAIERRKERYLRRSGLCRALLGRRSTRRERADASRGAIAANYDDKLRIFLDFVLGHYVDQGVEQLDQEKLGALVELKYGSAHEAEAALGSVGAIRDSFVGFQRYLYQR